MSDPLGPDRQASAPFQMLGVALNLSESCAFLYLIE